MKILILSNCPILEHQGSGYVIFNTSRVLRDSGHEVTLIPPLAFSFLPSILGERAKIYQMILGMAKWIVFHKKTIIKQDLLILYGAESFLALYILKRVYNLDIPVMLHSNGLEVHVGFRLSSYGERFLIKKEWYHLDLSKLFKYCYQHVDAILAVSQYDANFAVNHLRLSPKKVFYIEPALPDFFFNYRNSHILPSRKKIITYCGTWIERKGIASIKNGLPPILRKYRDFTFKIIGVGEEFKAEDYFPEDVLHQIKVYPLISKKEKLMEVYYESSIFLFPSFCESFGLVVPEAMFCGCAVITGATGFAANLKDNEEAVILNIPDGPNVIAALEKLITNDLLRRNISDNAVERTKYLKWSNYRKDLNHLLNHIIETKRQLHGPIPG